jgi:hypothetical protein
MPRRNRPDPKRIRQRGKVKKRPRAWHHTQQSLTDEVRKITRGLKVAA